MKLMDVLFLVIKIRQFVSDKIFHKLGDSYLSVNFFRAKNTFEACQSLTMVISDGPYFSDFPQNDSILDSDLSVDSVQPGIMINILICNSPYLSDFFYKIIFEKHELNCPRQI